MEHRGFFRRHGPFSISQVAEAAGARVQTDEQSAKLINDIRPLSDATAGDLSFLDNKKYVSALTATRAGACFVHPRFVEKVPGHTTALIIEEPYRALAKALGLFYPEAIHPRVCANSETPIAPSAALEEGVRVEPGAIVGPYAQIGARTVIAAGAIVGYAVTIGRDGYVGPNAKLTHALVGDRVNIHAGVAIGQDGFGFAMGPQGHLKVPQVGRVIIQDDVEVGANSAIDRGALNDTIIGEGTKIDNLVQIGHNVVIGRHCVIVGQTGISGSSVLEDFVVMGGQSGCVGHIRIGAGAQIAGKSGVSHSVPPGERWGGSPARPLGQWSREIAVTKTLGEMLKGKALARLKQLLS